MIFLLQMTLLLLLVQYTYFSHTNGHYSWIDHVFCRSSDSGKIKCDIIPEESNNVSDHLPVRLEFTMTNYDKTPSHLYISNVPMFSKPNWSNDKHNANFKNVLDRKLKELPEVTNSMWEACNVQKYLDDRFTTINECMHSAAKETGCVPNKMLKPKAFWCPELSKLCDKNRFWWNIWVLFFKYGKV